jgi:hypothetical protein
MSKLLSWVVLWMLAALALSGCDSRPSGVPRDAQRLASSAAVEVVRSEAYTAIPDKRRVVLRTQQEWEAFWSELHRLSTNTGPAPAVDFANEMVLVATAGQKPTGGYSVNIHELYLRGDELFAIVLETSPGPKCIVTEAFTAPVVVTRVPRSDGPVHFIDETAVHNCP